MLSLEINTKEREQHIILSGQLEGIEALEFRQKIISVIESNIDRFCLDVQNMDAIDLTGFNAVVMLKREIESRNKRFHLLAPTNNSIHEYIHLSKLNLNQTEVTRNQ